MAVIGKPDPGPIPCCRRQRRPAALGAAIPPANPGGSPDRIRRPAPAQVIVLEPAPIMKRSPTPRVAGEPIPPAVRIDPPARIAVRPPHRIGDDHRQIGLWWNQRP